MSVDEKDELDGLIDSFEGSSVYAAIVYGSYVRGEDYRDIDVALFSKEGIDEIVRDVGPVFDLKWFQDLPMYVKHRVLDDGDIVYLVDEDRFYEEVFDFVKMWEYFRPRYREYLEGVKEHG